MTLLQHIVQERYRHYLTLKQASQEPKLCIMITMLEQMILRLEERPPHYQKFVLETFQSMSYCRLMKILYTREDWYAWKAEIKSLLQYV
jgi:hypothetical protein